MPRKIRELIAELKKAGFVNRGGKGSHRNFVHDLGVQMVVSGKEGADAHHYQERKLHEALAALEKKQK